MGVVHLRLVLTVMGLACAAGCASDATPVANDAAGADAGAADVRIALPDATVPSSDGSTGTEDAAGSSDVEVGPMIPPLTPEQCRLPNAEDLPCTDGDDCTTGDRCLDGRCAGAPRICRQDGVVPECLGGTVWRVHDVGGVCSASACQFGFEDTTCLRGCGAGACDCPLLPWQHQAITRPYYTARGPAMAVDSAGGVHVSYLHHAGDDSFADTSVRYAYLAPGGSWTRQTVANLSTFRDFGNTAITVDASGRPFIVYQTNARAVGYASRSTAGVWTSSSAFTSSDLTNLAVGVDSLGTLHLAYSTQVRSFPTAERDLMYATLPAGSSAWNGTTAVTSGNPEDVSLSIDAANGVHVSYDDAFDRVAHAYLPSGGVWSATLLSPEADVRLMSSALDLDSAGGAHLSFEHAETAGQRRLIEHAARTPGGAWRTASLGMPTGAAEYAAFVPDGAGGLHVVFRDAADGSLDHAHRASGGMWTPSSIDAATGGLDQVSVALDGNGGLHVSYTDPAGTAVRYGYRRAGAGWVTSTVGTKDSGSDTTLTLDAAGGVHLFYYVVTGIRFRELYLAPSASTWTETGIAIRNIVGGSQAVTDGNGGLHVAYTIAGRYIDYAYRPAGGAWVAQEDIGSSESGTLSLAVDGTGAAHVFTQGQDGSLTHISGRSGSAFTTTSIASEAMTGPPSAGMDPSGAPVVVFTDASGLRHLVRSAAGQWLATSVSTGSLGPLVGLSVSSTGEALVFHADAATRSLSRSIRSAGGGWMREIVGESTGVQQTAVSVDTAGGVHVGYGNTFAFRPSGGTWVSSALAPAAEPGTLFSLGVDPFGGLHAAYLRDGAWYARNDLCP